MVGYLSSLLGRSSQPVKPVSQQDGPVHTALPAPFYHSEAVYQLERRAIFSKQWLFVCHERLLDENGKYQTYNIAGYTFFAIRGKDGEIRAFFNNCRHRGFPVVCPKDPSKANTTEVGKAQILACSYHNWSYSSIGTLAKAPGFQDVEGFDPKEHSLLPLPIHKDKNGFVYVNMDHSEDGISWKEQFGDLEDQERFKKFDWDNYSYAQSWGIDDAQYNWKILVDNYSECHHCQYTHPGFVQTTDLKTYNVECGQGYMAHYVKAKPEALTPGADPDKFAFNFIFPYGSHTLTPFYFYTMRICPTSATTCSVQYDVFRHKDCTDEVFAANHEFFVQVETEDKELCMGTQRGLEMGTYRSGPLHPTKERGVIYFQQKHLEALQAHHEKEVAAGHEIRGAQFQYRGKEVKGEGFLNEVESGCAGACGGDAEMEW
ncbi:hypothetical protein JCM8097_000716 [Rhodosporidiobolus ruineniae]